jgi:hypothetical protein
VGGRQVSDGHFPDDWEFTGKFPDLEGRSGYGRCKEWRIRAVPCGEFPKQQNRKYVVPEQGRIRLKQGSRTPDRGKDLRMPNVRFRPKTDIKLHVRLAHSGGLPLLGDLSAA